MEEPEFIIDLLRIADIVYVAVLIVLSIMVYLQYKKWKNDHTESIAALLGCSMILIIILASPYAIIKAFMVGIVCVLWCAFVTGTVWLVVHVTDAMHTFYKGDYTYIFAKNEKEKLLSIISKILRVKLIKIVIEKTYFENTIKYGYSFYALRCNKNIFKFIIIMAIFKCCSLDIEAPWIYAACDKGNLDTLRQHTREVDV